VLYVRAAYLPEQQAYLVLLQLSDQLPKPHDDGVRGGAVLIRLSNVDRAGNEKKEEKRRNEFIGSYVKKEISISEFVNFHSLTKD
jgi:hypothetical protein